MRENFGFSHTGDIITSNNQESLLQACIILILVSGGFCWNSRESYHLSTYADCGRWHTRSLTALCPVLNVLFIFQCFWSKHASDNFPLLFTAAVLSQFRDELLVCSTNEELLQVSTLAISAPKLWPPNCIVHAYSISNAVLTESQWQDTTACCTVSCSVNIWEIEVWWLLSSWHQGSETLLSIERVYCEGTLKNAHTSTVTLLSSRTLLHCLFMSPFFSPFQQSLLSNESYAPPPLVGFVRTRQKFTTLHSNKIEVRR